MRNRHSTLATGQTIFARRHLAALCVLAGTLPGIARADDATKFLYQPGRVPVGRAYEYLETNLDGSKGTRVWVYVPSEDRIESYTAPVSGRPARHVIASMDWLTCSTKQLDIRELEPNREPVERLEIKSGPDDRSFDAVGHSPEHAPVHVGLRWRPWHLYDVNLLTLEMALPHLVASRDSFSIGIVTGGDPSDGVAFRDHGLATLAYRGDEIHGGERCHMYEADGPGLDHRGGTIAVRERDGFFQELALGLPADSSRSGLRLALVKSSRMTPAAWSRLLRQAR